MTTMPFQGGFSDEVACHSIFQKYVSSGHPAGYIGSSSRTSARDKILEKWLRERGLLEAGIATWLTSGNGRHLMDDVDRKTTAEAFEKRVIEYTIDAFLDVTVWSHPDHTGFLKSSNELRQKLMTRFT